MVKKHKENSRVVKFIIAPTMAISFLMAFVIPEFRTVGALYFLMATFSLVIFSLKRFKEEVIGIKKGIAQPLFIGAGTALGFFILSKIAPSFSLLTPTISLAISEDVRFFVIVLLAPWIEEAWRSAVIGFIEDVYKPKKFWITNLAQSSLFSGLHVLVYGVALAAYAKWIEAFGALNAVLGSLIAALAFGLISGYMMKKFKNIIPSGVAHMIINFILIAAGLIVVAFILPLI